MLRKNLAVIISLVVITISGNFARADCPSADLNGDCFVDFEDFALMAAQWPTTDFNDLEVIANQWLTTDPCVPDDMIYIPDGEFEMGDHLGDGEEDELPIHTVLLDSFFMSKFEITNQQYCDYLNSAILAGYIKVFGGIVYDFDDFGNNYPYCATHIYIAESQINYNSISRIFSVRIKSDRDMSNDPMLKVNWHGAVAYCNWRSQQEGYETCYNLSTWDCDFSKKGYRLATEAEWEYAARGRLTGKRFPWGDTITHSQANYFSLSSFSYDISPTREYHPTWNDGIYPYTSPVGSFQANGYGLYDMAGNVWEWCNDWYSDTYYGSSPTNNPTGPTSGSSRVLRGGVWSTVAHGSRLANRTFTPDYRINYFGFRVVLDLN